MKWPFGVFCLFLAASAVAQVPVLRKTESDAMPANTIGVYAWGSDGRGYLKLEWQKHAGVVVTGDVAASRGEAWIASELSTSTTGTVLTALDLNGEVLRKVVLPDEIKDFRVLETGGKEPLFVTWGDLWGQDLRAFDVSGSEKWSFSIPGFMPGSVDVVPASAGGPLIVLGYYYGPVALRALDPQGRVVWESKEVDSANTVRVGRMDGRSVITANNGVGRISLFDLKGHVVDRIDAQNNMDRVLFDERKGAGALMYGLSSGSGTGHERFGLYQKNGDGGPWEQLASEDLGRITITAYALADLDGDGTLKEVVGTDNGWVLVLDRAGKVLSEARFPGSIRFLGVMKARKSSKDTLILCASGPNGAAYAFTRPEASRP